MRCSEAQYIPVGHYSYITGLKVSQKDVGGGIHSSLSLISWKTCRSDLPFLFDLFHHILWAEMLNESVVCYSNYILPSVLDLRVSDFGNRQ